jgi:FKBP-type peptidyl-prolyl cis-trans isomerase
MKLTFALALLGAASAQSGNWVNDNPKHFGGGQASKTYSDGLQADITHTPSSCTKLSKKGDSLKMLYTGKLTSGKVFDTTSNPGRSAFTFTLGVGEVIKGWDEGLIGRCETRPLARPPPSS